MSLLLARRGTLAGAGAAVEPEPSEAEGLITELGTLSTASTNNQVGWEFKVGSSDITATALRLYYPGATSGRTLRLWRVSDKTLLDDVVVDTVAETWVEGAITPVVLAAETNYVVTVKNDGESRYTANVGGFSFQSWVTYIQGRFLSSTGFPTGTAAEGIYGIADVVAEGP